MIAKHRKFTPVNHGTMLWIWRVAGARQEPILATIDPIPTAVALE